VAGFNIISVVGQKPKEAANLFRNLGFNFEPAMKDIISSEVTRIAELGLQASKSAVPVRTKELRDAIKLGNHGSLAKEVYIEASTHESSRTRFKLNNPTLAEILDEGYARRITHPDVIRPKRAKPKNRRFKRNFNSIPDGSFESIKAGAPTADWISRARNNIYQAVSK
jgi:hypothetical protein